MEKESDSLVITSKIKNFFEAINSDKLLLNQKEKQIFEKWLPVINALKIILKDALCNEKQEGQLSEIKNQIKAINKAIEKRKMDGKDIHHLIVARNVFIRQYSLLNTELSQIIQTLEKIFSLLVEEYENIKEKQEEAVNLHKPLFVA